MLGVNQVINNKLNIMQSSAVESSQVTVNYQAEAETGHHEHPDLRMFGLVVFLIAESMIFRLICCLFNLLQSYASMAS